MSPIGIVVKIMATKSCTLPHMARSIKVANQ